MPKTRPVRPDRTLAVRFPAAVGERLEVVAAAEGLSMSALVRRATMIDLRRREDDENTRAAP
jgi:hypothetical protein